MTATASPVLGRPLWYELMTTDMKAAEKFYKNVVGWTAAPFDGSPQPYTMFNRNSDIPAGGVMNRPEGMNAPPFWAMYVGFPKLEEGVAGLQTVERPNESRRPRDTPELSVRNRAETRLLLERDRCADRAVLDLTEALVVELALAVRSKRVLQLTRPEQTADVLCPMRQSAHGELRAADPFELTTAASMQSRRVP